jgi:hypothetical protein
MTARAVLEDIRRRDPEGKATRPTSRDRNAFTLWVVDTYGHQAWADYHTDWDR